ncbi:Phospholipase/carboxylesterase/thioesterase [Cyathus striatus]|nr:Phospholipase/carboxylesterase/thioesterase [Cyathus striatus]
MFRADPALSHVKWILPHSPTRPVTANMGIVMPREGMLKSAKEIIQLISTEVESGTDPSRIVIGGFSQGGTMSLLTGLTGTHKLAGIAVLSGWLPLKAKFKEMASKVASQIPVFYGHGSVDPLSNSSRGHWNPRGTPPSGARGLAYNSYDSLGHSTNPQELDHLLQWIKNAIPAGDAK